MRLVQALGQLLVLEARLVKIPTDLTLLALRFFDDLAQLVSLLVLILEALLQVVVGLRKLFDSFQQLLLFGADGREFELLQLVEFGFELRGLVEELQVLCFSVFFSEGLKLALEVEAIPALLVGRLR